MEALNERHAFGLTAGFNGWAQRQAWEIPRLVRALTRRIGLTGWCVLAMAVVIGMVSVAERTLSQKAADLALSLEREPPVAALPGTSASPQVLDGHARLAAFERHLLPHEDIPVALQDLLGLIEKEGLVALRGDYRPQVDSAGGFLRYHMSLPVKGSAAAIQRFMQEALRSQKTLVLQSVQFKRERTDSNEVEARIQWVLLTRLPEEKP